MDDLLLYTADLLEYGPCLLDLLEKFERNFGIQNKFVQN